MIRLKVDGLTLRRGDLAIVDGASFEVLPGEFVAVVGPSGAGKSMLGRLIAGLDSPDSGELAFNGHSVLATPPGERRIGMVFQGDSLWPHLSVAENVGVALKSQKLPRKQRQQKIEEALELSRIDAQANQWPEALTELQRRRAALARSLAGDPGLLIWDEPLGDLTGRAREEFREELRHLHIDVEATALLLTRDPKLALALADRVVVMDLGRMVQVGPPGEVYNRPVDAMVAQFLGPVNLLQGHLESLDGRGEGVIRTPLGRLVGRIAGDPVREGTPVTVAMRPETLRIGPGLPADANRFVATLERQVFSGESRHLYLRGPGDWPIQALALQIGTQGLREGQSLTIAVSPEHVVVMPGRYAPTRAIG